VGSSLAVAVGASLPLNVGASLAVTVGENVGEEVVGMLLGVVVVASKVGLSLVGMTVVGLAVTMVALIVGASVGLSVSTGRLGDWVGFRVDGELLGSGVASTGEDVGTLVSILMSPPGNEGGRCNPGKVGLVSD
jgi:hypothetical protein